MHNSLSLIPMAEILSKYSQFFLDLNDSSREADETSLSEKVSNSLR